MPGRDLEIQDEIIIVEDKQLYLTKHIINENEILLELSPQVQLH